MDHLPVVRYNVSYNFKKKILSLEGWWQVFSVGALQLWELRTSPSLMAFQWGFKTFLFHLTVLSGNHELVLLSTLFIHQLSSINSLDLGAGQSRAGWHLCLYANF